jgi:hypothetical protein
VMFSNSWLWDCGSGISGTRHPVHRFPPLLCCCLVRLQSAAAQTPRSPAPLPAARVEFRPLPDACSRRHLPHASFWPRICSSCDAAVPHLSQRTQLSELHSGWGTTRSQQPHHAYVYGFVHKLFTCHAHVDTDDSHAVNAGVCFTRHGDTTKSGLIIWLK